MRTGWLAALVLVIGGASSAFAQAPSCTVTTTWPTWTGGNGFGASLVITNNGPTINGWTLVFNMPNGQRLSNGWPVTFTQPAGSATVTVASDAEWNRTIQSGGNFTVGFNGTFTGANNPPASFTLNGTVCGGTPPQNTPPTASITAPTANQSFPAGTTSVNLAATASDAGGAVVRVEFRVDGVLVTTDTTAPYNGTATNLAAGTHTAEARAFDNGNPSLFTNSSVSFTIQGGGTNTPPQVSITAPTANQAFPAGTTSVNLAATASDPGGAVARVEFRVDNVLVGTDTTAPYNGTATNLAAGSHTAEARAFDNGNPALFTNSAVMFTIGTPPPLSISATPASLTIPGGTSQSSTVRLSAQPAGTVTVTITRSGSTAISAPASVQLNGTTWNTGVAVSFTAAAGTTAAQSTFALSATGYTGTTVTASRSTGGNALFRVNAAGRITKNNAVFPVHCGSWFGLEGRHEPSTDQDNPSGAPMEQYVGNTFWANGGAGTTRTVAQTMSEISGMGINTIRLPVVPQTLTGTDPQGVPLQPNGRRIFKNHASVMQTSSRAYLEQMIRAADAANIEVLLDIHSCSNYVGWRKGRLDARPPWVDRDRDNYDFKREDSSCAASGNPAGVTRIQAYNTSMWLDNLRTLAGIGNQLGVDNIIGIDIFNEPHDYTWADWSSLAGQAYNAINEVNPNILIFMEGVGTNANTQDGSPTTVTPVPHGADNTNPNWGENLFPAGAAPPPVPKERLVYSPHTYGPSVFVQKMFMDPAQSQCAGLEGDAAGNLDCNIVINPTLLRAGWEEHFGYLKQQNYAIVVGEFGGNMDWPLGQASIRDRNRWSHITPGVDQQWQNAFVDYMISKGIEGCYWSINPESGDTAGWYGHAYDPISNTSGWGEWRAFDQRKTNLLNRLWQGVP